MFKMNTEVIKRWYKKLKKNIIIGFGGKCCVCGYDRCMESFDFHHLDPSKKSFNISSFKIKNKAQIYEELKKCVMLCSNCHREYHAKMIEIKNPIMFDESKIPIKEIIMRECEVCKKPTKNSRFCCPNCSGIFSRKVNLSSEELLELVKTKSYTEIGNMFGVSEAAIRKRHKKLKKYNHVRLAQLDSASPF